MIDRKIFLFALLALAFALLGRLSFFEYVELVDPSEARYASVAQEMILGDDWVVPKLPGVSGLEPYLGKPPLHFWVTAGLYSIFGIDNWSSRMGGFLFALLVLAVAFCFGNKFFSRSVGIGAVLITTTSGLFYFFAGASMIDMTFTGIVTASVFLLYCFVNQPGNNRWMIFGSAALCGFGFLTKGPLSLVLVFLPVILWSVALRDWQWIKKIPWFSSGVVFLLVVAPWFVVSEVKNPGFLKYFFWNENIGRYLFEDYGDRYGRGHEQPYGASWVMLLSGFLPWSLVLLYASVRAGWRQSIAWVKSDSHRLFAVCWGITSPLFFTFVHQLHAPYILPSIASVAVLTSLLIDQRCQSMSESLQARLIRVFSAVAVVVYISFLAVGAFLFFSSMTLGISLGIGTIGFLLMFYHRRLRGGISLISFASCALTTIYLTGFAEMAPQINNQRSAKKVLQLISEDVPSVVTNHRIGVVNANCYSHYWISRSWEGLLERKVVIEHVSKEFIPSTTVGYLLVKTGSIPEYQPNISERFDYFLENGKWTVFKLRRG